MPPLQSPSPRVGEQRKTAQDRLIVALDFPTQKEALGLADHLHGSCKWFKVGLELYLASGNSILEELRKRGYSVFLDLKLHDIPNTVAAAVKTVSTMGASLLTLHAAGGPAMLTAAAEAAASVPGAPRLLAVTVLTSMDDGQLKSTGVSSSAPVQVLRLAQLARAAGISGLVCSAQEVRLLRGELGPEPVLVTPGIRPAGAAINDQKRIATPAVAIADGASMLVVGRPITQAPDPAAAANSILAEIESAS
jgi:orotidine-5'-phosphate decarboxylase